MSIYGRLVRIHCAVCGVAICFAARKQTGMVCGNCVIDELALARALHLPAYLTHEHYWFGDNGDATETTQSVIERIRRSNRINAFLNAWEIKRNSP